MSFPTRPTRLEAQNTWYFKQKARNICPSCAWHSAPAVTCAEATTVLATDRGALTRACTFSGHKSDYLEMCHVVKKCGPAVSVNCHCCESIIIPLIQTINIHRTLTTASLMSTAIIYSFPINIHWCWHSFSLGTVIRLFWINHHAEALSVSLTAIISAYRRKMNKLWL